MRVLTEWLDHRHNVCGAQAAGNWAGGRSVSLHVMYVFMVITYSKGKDQPGEVTNLARGQLNRENGYFSVRVRA